MISESLVCRSSARRTLATATSIDSSSLKAGMTHETLRPHPPDMATSANPGMHGLARQGASRDYPSNLLDNKAPAKPDDFKPGVRCPWSVVSGLFFSVPRQPVEGDLHHAEVGSGEQRSPITRKHHL